MSKKPEEWVHRLFPAPVILQWVVRQDIWRKTLMVVSLGNLIVITETLSSPEPSVCSITEIIYLPTPSPL